MADGSLPARAVLSATDIERIARAVFSADRVECGVEWPGLGPETQETYRVVARVAVLAASVAAGAETLWRHECSDWVHRRGGGWGLARLAGRADCRQAMRDAFAAMATPAPPPLVFNSWPGQGEPPAADTPVRLRLRNGDEEDGVAGDFNWRWLDLHDSWEPDDIVAFARVAA